MKILQFLTISVLIALSSGQAQGAEIHGGGEAVLFSKMTGTVYFQGLPASNAKLIRTINFGEPTRDSFVTDSSGRFELPAVVEENAAKLASAEFAVGQEIMLEFEGRRYLLWSAVKRNPEANSEAQGGDLEMECEITGLNQLVQVDGHPMFTPCTWSVETDYFTPGF